MSTFLVCLGVVAVAIGVLRIALSDPDQPATVRRDTGSGRRRRPPDSGPSQPAGPAWPERSGSRSRARVRARRRVDGAWARLRSGLALVILVVFVGLTVAAMIGVGVALAARALTNAIG